MSKRNKKSPVVGIAWYRPEEWDLLKACADDPEALEDTHEQWLASASKAISQLMEQGIIARKVYLNLGDWLEWCEKNNKRKDSASRSEFVSVLMHTQTNFGAQNK